MPEPRPAGGTSLPAWLWPLLIVLGGGGGVAAINATNGATTGGQTATIEAVQGLEKLHDQRLDQLGDDIKDLDNKVDGLDDKVDMILSVVNK